MTGRLSFIAYVMATGWVHFFSVMPKPNVLLAAGLSLIACSVLVFFLSPQYKWRLLLPVWAMALGLVLTIVRIDHRLADVLEAGSWFV